MKVERLRLIIQAIAFLIFTYGGLASINLGSSLPTFACPYVESRGGACFLMPFQHLLGMSFKALKGWYGIRLITISITFILLTVLFNKAWCGWTCPLGFIQDLQSRLRRFLRIERVRFSWGTHDKLKSVKYILLFLMILIPIGIGNSFWGMPKLSRDLAAPFCQICPARPLLPLFIGDSNQIFIDFSSHTRLALSFLAMCILGLLLVGSFMKLRFICAFCPLSALMSLGDNIGLLQLKKSPPRCTKCGICQHVCDMEIRELYEERVREKLVTQDCMLCLKCIAACPEDLALKTTFFGKTVFASSFEGFMARQGIKAEDKGKEKYEKKKQLSARQARKIMS